MKKENICIVGDSVILKSVTENEIDDYLYIRRFATVFKMAYDADNELWARMRQALIDDVKGENVICHIYLKKSKEAIGYIELEMADLHHPNVGIGILEEERKKGYAFETSALLINRVFENEEIEYIKWMTTEGNEASNRIALKLGGKFIRTEPIIPEDVMERWGDEIFSESKVPSYVVYGIYRQ